MNAGRAADGIFMPTPTSAIAGSCRGCQWMLQYGWGLKAGAPMMVLFRCHMDNHIWMLPRKSRLVWEQCLFRAVGVGGDFLSKFPSFKISELLPFVQCHMDAALRMVPYRCHIDIDLWMLTRHV